MRYATSQKALQRLEQEQSSNLSPSQSDDSISHTESPQAVDLTVRDVDRLVLAMGKGERERDFSMQAGKLSNGDSLHS